MGFLHVVLVHHRILERSINALVSEKLLYLLDRHALVDCHCSQRPAKLMRMHLVEVQLTTDFTKSNLNTADLQPTIRLQQRNE